MDLRRQDVLKRTHRLTETELLIRRRGSRRSCACGWNLQFLTNIDTVGLHVVRGLNGFYGRTMCLGDFLKHIARLHDVDICVSNGRVSRCSNS